MEASLAALERPRVTASSNTVFKSGPLFISSKGLGWTSWKKRWFILTRTSLVFFKNDPGTLPQKGGEVNLTLGGIDLNNSGSVVVREDKKLLTVLFPDGRDGRAFTLKAETFEDLYEWKTALEQALAHAPNAALIMGHNGIFRSETNEAIEGRDKRQLKSLVVGRPILLALEDIDGSPSFLEKALQFIEKYGTKIEGILRQAADVEEVERRVQDYEEGKTEFTFDEDPHVVADCIKHVLRELPSSPVSASCCTALLEAYRIESKEARISSLRSAIAETFPEPNRRLLQRILKMMHTISSHSHENRMNPSAVAACMAPLLLRPLLAGECDLEDDFDSGEDNSAQLLAAANAANNAQAIIATLLEDYGSIFDEENIQRCSISTESHIGNSGPDDSSDDDNNPKNKYHNAENEVEPVTDDDNERALSGKMSESSGCTGSDLYEYKGFVADDSDIESPRDINGPAGNSNVRTDHVVRNPFVNSTNRQAGEQIGDDPTNYSDLVHVGESYHSSGKVLNALTHGNTMAAPSLESSSEKPMNKGTPSSVQSKRATFWSRGSVRKISTDGSFDSSGEDEVAIQRLETTKNELRQRIAKEARGNAILQASLERRKQALHERRISLEQDVSRLQEQLQAERDLRAALEVGLSMSSGQFSSHGVDSKTRAELEEIALAEADVARLKQKVAELHHQLNQQRHTHFGSFSNARDNHQYLQNHNSQKRFLQQDFDSTLAFVNHERKQRHEENLVGGEWRNSKGAGSFGVGNSRQASRKQIPESPNVNDSRISEESGKMSVDKFSSMDSPSAPSTSRALDITEYPRLNHPSAAASAALVELTTRLDFFKERRSQLMEQLQNLDLNYGSSSSQDFIHRPSSPPWN
ncbi:hypothetical protein AALP_AA8G216000 [Arabis alpina]|uniref:Rho GTPase-activating protein 7-like n=1 Tax=Arabis alpina TaxID=50452 RepID=A0A087G8K2_ARAAL|nr:hypothetical protein AALP_AA8G216000 [Arabis alpina]